MALQIRQHGRRWEYTGQWLMTVKQIPWILLHHDGDRIEQPLQASLFYKGGAEIGHDKITAEHHTMIGKMDKKRIASFSPFYWDEFDSRCPDFHLGMTIERDIRFETLDILETKSASEEARTKKTGSVKHYRKLFLVVLPGIE